MESMKIHRLIAADYLDREYKKKAWPSTMVSMSSLMKQVKYGNKAAAQAKEEVAITGLHILTKVDELKKKQELAKETNEKVVG
ncbi:hypothetical protein Tco_0586354 [Tanacetum coccineum]